MSDPEATDRERLLRLIDGGPEVVKEVQKQRESSEKKPVPVVPAAAAPAPKAADAMDIWLDRLAKRLAGFRWDKALWLWVAVAAAVVLFTLRAPAKIAMTRSPAPVAGSVDEESMTLGVRLVGVDWGEPPVAMLEDLKTGKTYFVKKNDRIRDMQVKEIFKDKVNTSFHGRTVELR